LAEARLRECAHEADEPSGAADGRVLRVQQGDCGRHDLGVLPDHLSEAADSFVLLEKVAEKAHGAPRLIVVGRRQF
jgi:hypothetical protein